MKNKTFKIGDTVIVSNIKKYRGYLPPKERDLGKVGKVTDICSNRLLKVKELFDIYPFENFEIAPIQEVSIYTKYTVYATTNKQAEEIVAYQKKIFGYNNPAGLKYEYWFDTENKYGYGYMTYKGWYKKQPEAKYNQAKSLSFNQWKKMIEYQEYLKNNNMKDKKITGYKLLKCYKN